jgi:hypothetical protein
MKRSYLEVAEKIQTLYIDCLFDDELSNLDGVEEQDFLIALSYVSLASHMVRNLAIQEDTTNE